MLHMTRSIRLDGPARLGEKLLTLRREKVPDPQSRVSISLVHQPRATTGTQRPGWRMMAHPTQERLCHMGTHG